MYICTCIHTCTEHVYFQLNLVRYRGRFYSSETLHNSPIVTYFPFDYFNIIRNSPSANYHKKTLFNCLSEYHPDSFLFLEADLRLFLIPLAYNQGDLGLCVLPGLKMFLLVTLRGKKRSTSSCARGLPSDGHSEKVKREKTR